MTKRIQFSTIRISPWQFWLMGVIGVSFTVALLVLAAGLFLILAPVALAAGVYYRLRHGGDRQPQADRVIDADYTVVNERSRKLEPRDKR